ncbi:MAG TPA: flagellar biosynthetic protein FliO [Terriglobales bacterium]|jgi:hypothetical protein|nr:flagellar biosynthetic protein FliO [Terriglobales bacterium]
MNFFKHPHAPAPGGEAVLAKMAGIAASGRDSADEFLAQRWPRWLAVKLRSCWQRRSPPRQLRVAETLALGERRFLLLVEAGAQKFLIGSGGGAMTLLAELHPEKLGCEEPGLQECRSRRQRLEQPPVPRPGPGLEQGQERRKEPERKSIEKNDREKTKAEDNERRGGTRITQTTRSSSIWRERSQDRTT